jgi:cytochrome c-type biogenesis protein CcmH/NrfG
MPGPTTWTFAMLALGLVMVTCWLVCKPLLRAGPEGQAPAMSRWTAVWLSTAAVMGMSVSYLKVGQWEAIEVGPGHRVQAGVGAPAVDASRSQPESALPHDMVGLTAYLRRTPGDALAWKRLAQLCEQAGLLQEAVSAYRAWARLVPGDADTLSRYAVTLAMSNGQGLVGEPEALMARALRISPEHVPSLQLAAEAALERNDPQAAQIHFNRLLEVLPEEDPRRAALLRRMPSFSPRTAP